MKYFCLKNFMKYWYHWYNLTVCKLKKSEYSSDSEYVRPPFRTPTPDPSPVSSPDPEVSQDVAYIKFAIKVLFYNYQILQFKIRERKIIDYYLITCNQLIFWIKLWGKYSMIKKNFNLLIFFNEFYAGGAAVTFLCSKKFWAQIQGEKIKK